MISITIYIKKFTNGLIVIWSSLEERLLISKLRYAKRSSWISKLKAIPTKKLFNSNTVLLVRDFWLIDLSQESAQCATSLMLREINVTVVDNSSTPLN